MPDVASIPLRDVEISYDEVLPITAWHDEIATTIRAHQVVVIAGETGSGKTTQLPKICLELGRRTIAHTQPRRIAARTVAERIAEELDSPLGELVGYRVRFTRKTSDRTALTVMTDGVLLAEIGRDRELRRYDTIIVDEAHERSLNIDFLLGYLKQLLPRRRDLKVLITSATIDTARFAEHFAAPDGTPAPIIEVTGRSYPVEVRYRPLLVDGEIDQVQGITDAVQELCAVGGGDILVFLSGEREIRDTADALHTLQEQSRELRHTEVLPLYARLSAAEQHRVFAPHPGRRVVLATNVAETSLTVPGIRYVVDAGTARISRYSARTKVQRLPIEPVSQASANQRAGRCGRVAPGVCIRLYSEEDFLARPEYTEPEILRTNLAAVILQMAEAKLGAIASFPFVEAPDRAQINDGLRLLDELGALAGDPRSDRPRLTDTGRRLAAVPVDPRLGRMLLEGERQGALRELLVIVSGLSIVDPRERPAEHRDAADTKHRRFWAPVSGVAQDDGSDAEPVATNPGAPEPLAPEPTASDFLAWLRLWDYVCEAQQRLSGNAFRRLCREEYLHFLRIREWQDLHTQLKQVTRELGLRRNDTAAAPDRVHTAALAGLLSHVGLADVRTAAPPGPRRGRRPTPEYLGARGTRFAINPGSSAARSSPPLVMAAEIVETTRLWARTVAPIDAAQVEEVGAHLLKRSYSEPHWSARAGSVMAYEQVTLYGVPIIARRQVAYGRIDPVEARAIFLRSALVEGLWRSRHPFLVVNAKLRAEVEALEERSRRRDLVVDDDTIYAFYDARVPADVTSAAHFDRWWGIARRTDPELLTLTVADLSTERADTVRPDDYPDVWSVGDQTLDLDYVFDPGRDDDGVTVRVPLTLLNQLDPDTFSWQVPGLRSELAVELLRTLPKDVRRRFVPAPEYAARALAWIDAHPTAGESLPEALSRALRAVTGEVVETSSWRPSDVPAHLRPTFVITDPDGAVLDRDPELPVLQQRLAPALTSSLSAAAAHLTRSGERDWVFGAIPERVSLGAAEGYPGLVDEGNTVGLAVYDTPGRARDQHAAGLRRVVLLATPDPTRWVVGHLTNADKLALAAGPYPSVALALADLRLASVGELIRRQQPSTARDQDAFARLCDAVRQDNPTLLRELVHLSATIIRAAGEVQALLPATRSLGAAAVDDVAEQVGNLVFSGFAAATAYARLADLPRYLQAARLRLQALPAAATRDAAGLEVVLRAEDAYAELATLAPPGRLPEVVSDVGWLLEELRVSLFAQALRTRVPVSEKRFHAAIAAARTAL